MTALIDTWSTDPAEEDGMTDEHAWIWREMIRCIPQKTALVAADVEHAFVRKVRFGHAADHLAPDPGMFVGQDRKSVV